MSLNIPRNEGLVQLRTYDTEGSQADALIATLRVKWALLRDKGYAGDYPVKIPW